MRLGPWLALFLAVAVAAPGAAGAQLAPPPTVVTFDDIAAGTQLQFTSQGVLFTDGDNCGDVNGDARAHSAPNVLGGGTSAFTCNPMQATFSEPQSHVSLFASHTQNQGPAQGRATLTAYRTCGLFQASDPIVSDVADVSSSALVPLSVSDPAGTIACVTLDVSVGNYYVVDDLSFSRHLQPDTEITAGPAGSTGDTTATFTFRANQAASFECALQPGPFEPCSSPRRLDGLAIGFHTLQVRAVDIYGAVDPTPAAHAWTVIADVDIDSVLNANDNCPSAANTDQADADRDGIGDACELLPPGNVPAVAGQNVIASDVRGEVFVKLPRGTPRGLNQDAGFIPIKGVASLPVNTVVDSRKGSLAIQSAANSRPAGDRRLRAHKARLAAGIFRIRQTRDRRKPGRRIPTDAVLVSGAGAERACAGARRRRPPKRVVRTLTMSGKGFFRAVGGASIGKARDATFITTDRCDGTRTEVGRGKVTVRDIRRKRKVVVRGGRGYIVKRPQFLPIKGQNIKGQPGQ